MALIERRAEGLYCPRGDFYIDPWRPVARAVLTHAHADHARAGSAQYFAAQDGAAIFAHRLGADALIEPLAYAQTRRFNDVRVSLHPAGHILGSAQVRVEADGEVWVVTGDYKRDPDPTCAPFELVPCDTLITEATFALPVYRWQPASLVAREVLAWWDDCVKQKIPAILFCYALGKAQRLLAELALLCDRPVQVHGALLELTAIYRRAGVPMLETVAVADSARERDFAGELILAPPSAASGPWMRRFRHASTGFASGWMQVRGNRRRRGYDRGFVLSDHADWPALVATARECGAQRVLATHGDVDSYVRFLCEAGIDAAELATEFGGETGAH